VATRKPKVSKRAKAGVDFVLQLNHHPRHNGAAFPDGLCGNRCNRDASNGTFPLACLAICANRHIDFEVSPIPFRQRLLDRSLDLIRILDGHGSAHKMGKSDR